MSWWQALILGIVEGLTEYVPVSSTGHLILTAWALGLDEPKSTYEATNSFSIIIQSGAILAVLGLYWPRIKQMCRGLVGKDGPGLHLAINLLIAFLPAAVIGPLFADQIQDHLFRPWPVVGALFVGAWLMLAVAYSRKQSHTEHKGLDLDHITWQIAVLIGFGQCIAMWPGTSRSMITIVAALIMGLRPRAAAEFSFLLGLITLSAATGYKVVFDGSEMMASLDAAEGNAVLVLAIGVIASAVSAAVAVKWFVGYVTRHGVALFGWYRLVLASVLAALIGWGVVTIPSNGNGEAPLEKSHIEGQTLKVENQMSSVFDSGGFLDARTSRFAGRDVAPAVSSVDRRSMPGIDALDFYRLANPIKQIAEIRASRLVGKHLLTPTRSHNERADDA